MTSRQVNPLYSSIKSGFTWLDGTVKRSHLTMIRSRVSLGGVLQRLDQHGFGFLQGNATRQAGLHVRVIEQA